MNGSLVILSRDSVLPSSLTPHTYRTVMGTVFDPQGDEKATFPLLFFTLIVKPTVLVPKTVLDAGDTWIRADGVAVIVPLPVNPSS